MKHLNEYINEELENTTFWLLDKWFETNENDKVEFMSLISLANNANSVAQADLEQAIEGTEFAKHLKEFINFIENDVRLPESTDYTYKLKKLIDFILSNKNNDYNQR